MLQSIPIKYTSNRNIDLQSDASKTELTANFSPGMIGQKAIYDQEEKLKTLQKLDAKNQNALTMRAGGTITVNNIKIPAEGQKFEVVKKSRVYSPLNSLNQAKLNSLRIPSVFLKKSQTLANKDDTLNLDLSEQH